MPRFSNTGLMAVTISILTLLCHDFIQEASAKENNRTKASAFSSNKSALSPERKTNIENEIRAQSKKFEIAFNNRDCETIKSIWLEHGTHSTIYGDILVGSQAIASRFEQFFKNMRPQKIQVECDQIIVINDKAAIEKGRVLTLDSDLPDTIYQALLLENNGDWKMASVVETLQPARKASIEDISWLLGEWSARGETGTASITAIRGPVDNHIQMTIKTDSQDSGSSADTQIIGIDPGSGDLVSRLFGNDGSEGTGIWVKSKASGAWVVYTRIQHPDGHYSVSRQMIKQVDSDNYTWTSTNNVYSGVSGPDKEVLKITRNRR